MTANNKIRRMTLPSNCSSDVEEKVQQLNKETPTQLNTKTAQEDGVDVENITDSTDLSAVYRGLSQLGLNAAGTNQVFLNLTLVDKELNNLGFLSSYEQLQIVDVSHNFLSDLKGLEHLQYLISLNVSNNQLTNFFDDKHPKSIREVNFSYNNITDIADLSAFTHLNTLLLDHNSIKDIKGLENCCHLKNLSLSFNNISRISGLNDLPVKQIDLSNNNLKKIENIQGLKRLQYINLSCNKIRSLKGLQDHPLLEEINLEKNEVLDISEIRYLRNLSMLRILNFNDNPIQNIKDYRLSVLFKIPVLVELDSTPVTAEEKVCANNLYKPSENLIASRDYMYNLMVSYQQPTMLLDSTLSTSEPYPMLIITGPLGLGKKHLAKKLSLEFPNFFGVGVGHTTRPICTNLPYGNPSYEQIGVSYNYLSSEDFDLHRDQGIFIQTHSFLGHNFGISRQVIENVAEQGLACILTMEFEGVMTFKKSHYEPRYVLVLPKDRKMYQTSLEQSGRYNECQVSTSVARIDKYIAMNQNHPGYFDAIIMTDSFDDRYVQLKQTVLEYLGITPNNTSVNSFISVASTKQVQSNGRLISQEKEFSSSPFLRNVSSSVWKLTDSESQLPSVQSSYERRFEKTRAAMLGVTSSFDEQIREITTPSSATIIPYMKACEDLKSHFISAEKSPSLTQDGGERSSTKCGGNFCDMKECISSKDCHESSSTFLSSDEAASLTSDFLHNEAEFSSSNVSVL